MPDGKVVCIIAARSTSNRLPGKVYLPFGDTSMSVHIARQAQQAKLVDETWAAIPYNDQQLVRYLSNAGVNVYTGPYEDVLWRIWTCAIDTNASHIVRITMDCPLLTPWIIDDVVDIHTRRCATYTANRLEEPKYPDGFDVEVFTFGALREASTIPYLSKEDKEHVTPYIKRTYPNNTVYCCRPLLPYQSTKLSVDTWDDYQRVLKWKEDMKWK